MVRRDPPTGWRLLALLAVTFGASSARAEGDAAALFERGRDLMLEGRFDSACPLVATSLRAEFTPGTLFTLAECFSREGRMASAIDRYSEFVDLWHTLPAGEREKHKLRFDVATKERVRLLESVPTVDIVVPSSAPDGTIVTLDGDVVDPSALGRPLRVDPGTHVVAVRAPGSARTTRRVHVKPGDRLRVEMSLRGPSTPAREPPEPLAAGEHERVPEPALDGGVERDSTLAHVAGGVGAAGLVVGTVFGIVALSKKSTVDAECDGRFCSKAGKDAADSGKTAALVSNVGFTLAIVGGATATYLVLSAESESSHAGPSRLTVVGVGGTF